MKKIKENQITRKSPGNGLPKWVREAAATRGYADAVEPLSLYVTDEDISEAFDCAGHGDGAKCVMAQAGRRLGAKSVYFYRSTAWVDFGTGPILRFATSKPIYRNIIQPFDKGDRVHVISGVYPLLPPSPARKLERNRDRQKEYSKRKSSDSGQPHQDKVVMHTERVVMAAQSR